MPIYEYQCEACGQVFEATQKMSDPPLKKHPDCKSKKAKKTVKRLISSTSFQLKGSGWYVTDYKKDSKKPSEEPAKAEDKKTEDKTDDKKSEGKKTDDKKSDPDKPSKKGKKGKDAA
jgi:putative FmdB family regulatory protein